MKSIGDTVGDDLLKDIVCNHVRNQVPTGYVDLFLFLAG